MRTYSAVQESRVTQYQAEARRQAESWRQVARSRDTRPVRSLRRAPPMASHRRRWRRLDWIA